MIPFLRLTPGEDAPDVRAAISRVIERGWFVLGPELDAFESEFAAAVSAKHAVGVGTGTDAIAIALRTLGIGPGDEVITSPVSAAYSALAIMMVGARPVFADIDPQRLTMSASAADAAVTRKTRALLPVHLYGQPADMRGLMEVAASHHLAVVEDCCQAHLATCSGRPVGSFGVAAAYSFYPTKNLGALGDGGAITYNDAQLAAHARRLRNGGQTDRYHHGEFGVNSPSLPPRRPPRPRPGFGALRRLRAQPRPRMDRQAHRYCRALAQEFQAGLNASFGVFKRDAK